MITVDDVRRIALGLPGTFEQASYGDRPSFRTKPRMFTWVPEDPDALMVWVDSVEEKEALIASQPDTFFTTDHYAGEAIVLVRLEAVDPGEAAELITESFRLRAPKTLVRQLEAG
jgi:hypothetical protein